MPAADPKMSCRCNNYQVTYMQVTWTHNPRLHRTTLGLMRDRFGACSFRLKGKVEGSIHTAFAKHGQVHTVLWQQEQQIGASPFPFDAVQNLYLGSSLQPVNKDMTLLHSRALAATASSVHWSICACSFATFYAKHTTCIAHSAQLPRVQPGEKAQMPCTDDIRNQQVLTYPSLFSGASTEILLASWAPVCCRR